MLMPKKPRLTSPCLIKSSTILETKSRTFLFGIAINNVPKPGKIKLLPAATALVRAPLAARAAPFFSFSLGESSFFNLIPSLFFKNFPTLELVTFL